MQAALYVKHHFTVSLSSSSSSSGNVSNTVRQIFSRGQHSLGSFLHCSAITICANVRLLPIDVDGAHKVLNAPRTHGGQCNDAVVAKICFKPCIATKWGRGGAAMLPFWVVGQINLLNLSEQISLNF